jgi:hypothetical protein
LKGVIAIPTPPKPYQLLKSEKKSHRTNSELNQRKQGEASLATGVKMKEWKEVKNNPYAHKEFKRINELLENIEKNDAIHEGVINRYCTIVAECKSFEIKTRQIDMDLEELNEQFSDKQIEYEQYIDYKDRLITKQISIDKQIQAKRKMLFDIEKENLMTIAAALRSIPKKTDSKKNALLEALGGD